MTKNFADRGFSGKYSENTMLVFQKAIEVGAELKKNNIEINTWTVNRKDNINDLIDKEVDILIGNYPDLVKK
ncbi:glycerophosphodiester phosphodiesterase [Fusobacterium nucleatum subsp. nucleatum]|uniref:Glycerophosphodiester phosphodiesterase n=1 Tax=Fusobacterium nucleatum subsp. nucleatum TaxID=76856 RepID=A0A124GCM1_FUSNC|nr:glycerophosphodiester phosphodiesterase [Fusobacterium nucleatum subsp. nucleatum]